MSCASCKDKTFPPNQDGIPYIKCGTCGRELSESQNKPSQRSSQQNRAIHKWFEMVAEELDRNGHSMQDVVAQIKKAEIRPTPHAVKAVMWHPMQEALYGTTSTTELTTAQVDRVFEMLNAFLGREFELSIPFPTDEC